MVMFYAIDFLASAQRKAKAFVDPTLALVADDLDRTDFASPGHVGAAVGLGIQTDDLDDANPVDAFGHEAHLVADQIRNGKRLVRREDMNPNVAVGLDLGVDLGLDFGSELGAHPLELEVHTGLADIDFSAGNRCLVIAPDDTTEDVGCGMPLHQCIPPIPVQLAAQPRTRGWDRTLKQV